MTPIRGRKPYTAALGDGSKREEFGYIRGHFAISDHYFTTQRLWWTVTHCPSGRIVSPEYGFSKLAYARGFADALMALDVDWSAEAPDFTPDVVQTVRALQREYRSKR